MGNFRVNHSVNRTIRWKLVKKQKASITLRLSMLYR